MELKAELGFLDGPLQGLELKIEYYDTENYEVVVTIPHNAEGLVADCWTFRYKVDVWGDGAAMFRFQPAGEALDGQRLLVYPAEITEGID